MISTFQSERLTFRLWRPEDRDPFRAMNADPQVMRFFPKPLNHDESDKFLATIETEFRHKGHGLWAVETRSDKQFIGFIGFHEAIFSTDFSPCVEIGWRLQKEFWGKGYATEGASRCLRLGFEDIQLDKIYSFTAKTNEASENVMKKIGLKKVGDFLHPRLASQSELSEHVLYCLTKEGFDAQRIIVLTKTGKSRRVRV